MGWGRRLYDECVAATTTKAATKALALLKYPTEVGEVARILRDELGAVDEDERISDEKLDAMEEKLRGPERFFVPREMIAAALRQLRDELKHISDERERTEP